MHLSRRSFLALSAVVLVGCNTTDDEPSADSTSSPSPEPEGTDTATTAPPTAPPPSSTATTTAPPAILERDPFTLGVASGDPDATSVVLWTRLTELPAEGIDVEWEAIAADGTTVDAGTVRAEATTGGSVHVVASLTEPADFRFRAGGFESPAGRAAPLAATDTLRLATASCQHYETGFYAAHRDIAEWAPDLVLFLGDFIYEGDAIPVGEGRVRTHEGPEPTDVEGYRTRYATYLADEQLQAARAACPWLVVWDDHEVENNYAGLVPQDPAESATFEERRWAAYQAWWEHMPTRLPRPDPTTGDFRIHRSIDVGDLIAISALDGRQYRSDQVCDTTLDTGPPCPGWDDETRTMLGMEQEAWLAERFASSTARWNCVAQQTVMTDLRFADSGAILNYDQWDGYHPARNRLLTGAPSDLVVLTGDIHLAGIGHLGDPGSAPAGVEFVTSSISSSANVPPDLAPLLMAYSNVIDAELLHRGYTRHTVTPERWTAEYRMVDDEIDPDSTVSTWKTFVVEHGSTAVTTA
jgi:alkaline phosphatase D